MWILVAPGLGVITYNLPIGIAMLAAGPVSQFITVGIQINFDEKTYRDYTSFFGAVTGAWYHLPEIEYISIYGETYSQTTHSLSNSYKKSDSAIAVQLVCPTLERIFICDSKNKADAFNTASVLSQHLQLRILDSTVPGQKWHEIA